MDGRRNNSLKKLGAVMTEALSATDRCILHEEAFLRLIALEGKRAQRSQKQVLLALFELESQMPSEKNRKVLDKMLSALAATTRETDVTGWYREHHVVGVMFTEFGIVDQDSIPATIMARVNPALSDHLTLQQLSQVSSSFHMFPEESIQRILPSASAPPLYSDFSTGDDARRVG